jgi:hypothetical protein
LKRVLCHELASLCLYDLRKHELGILTDPKVKKKQEMILWAWVVPSIPPHWFLRCFSSSLLERCSKGGESKNRKKSVGRRVRVRHRKIDAAAGVWWGQINQSFVMQVLKDELKCKL